MATQHRGLRWSIRSNKLDAQLNAALSARRTATGLLERAKRAVEIAIEQSEEAALEYLHRP